MTEKTPAQERAEREGIPQVLVPPFELLRIASGNPVMVYALDGSEVLVRIPTPEELLDQAHKAGQRLAAQGLPPGPGMSWQDAERLTRPLSI